MPLKFPGPLMRMTYVEYKMHNVLLNNSQPIIGPNARRCVSLMDLCFLRIDSRPNRLRDLDLLRESVRDNDHRSTRRMEGKLLRRMRQSAMTNASLTQTIPALHLLLYAFSQKLPNYKTHSVNRRAERGRVTFRRA